MDDGLQMIRKAYLNFWFRWAKKKMNKKYCVQWSRMNNVLPAEFFLCLLWVEVFVLDDRTECVPLLYWESLERPVSTLSKNIVGSILCDCSLPHSLHSESKSKSYMRSWRRVHQLHHYKDMKFTFTIKQLIKNLGPLVIETIFQSLFNVLNNNVFHLWPIPFLLISIALLLHFFVFSNF